MTTYYRMRGMDADVRGVYDTWTAPEQPDVDGLYYAGPLARPLRDVVIVARWQQAPGTAAAGDTVELKNAFADPSLEMDALGQKFRVAQADQAQLDAATASGAATAADLAAHKGAGDTAHAVATGSVAGFMSAADKSKLDSLSASKQLTFSWFSPPTTPSGLDDDFTQGSPDLATRGWLIAAGGVTQTRAGEVQPWVAPNTIPANQYRSSITKSGLLLQTNTGCFITKQVTPPFAAWAVSSHGIKINSTTSFGGTIQVFDSYPFNASAAQRRAFTNHYNDLLDIVQMDLNNAYSNLVTSKTYSTEVGYRTMLGTLVACDTSKNIRLAIMDAQRDALISAYSYNWAAFVPKAVGFEVRVNEAGATPGSWVLIRSFRVGPSYDSWPGMY